MKFFAIVVTAFMSTCMAGAQAVASTSGDLQNTSATSDMPDRFMSVTAENGQEWLEQCEWPAHKSDSMTRIAACVSFLQGARIVASRRNVAESCAVDLASQSRGTLLTTTYQVARRYPRLPIHKVFRIAFDSVDPGSC